MVAIDPDQVAKRIGMIVERDRAGMRKAERIDPVSHSVLVDRSPRAVALDRRQVGLADRVVGLMRAELVVVRNQRVHPVDGDELAGDRVRRSVVVEGGADDAG